MTVAIIDQWSGHQLKIDADGVNIYSSSFSNVRCTLCTHAQREPRFATANSLAVCHASLPAVLRRLLLLLLLLQHVRE